MINKIYESYNTLKQVSVENILDRIILDLHNLDDKIVKRTLCKSILAEMVILRPFNEKKFSELDSKTQMLMYVIIEVSGKIGRYEDKKLDNTFMDLFIDSLDGKYNEIETIYKISSNLVNFCSKK